MLTHIYSQNPCKKIESGYLQSPEWLSIELLCLVGCSDLLILYGMKVLNWLKLLPCV